MAEKQQVSGVAPDPRAPVPADDMAATMNENTGRLIWSIAQTTEDILGKTRYIISSLGRVGSYNIVSKDGDCKAP